jgi:hypothetical protein
MAINRSVVEPFHQLVMGQFDKVAAVRPAGHWAKCVILSTRFGQAPYSSFATFSLETIMRPEHAAKTITQKLVQPIPLLILQIVDL